MKIEDENWQRFSEFSSRTEWQFCTRIKQYCSSVIKVVEQDKGLKEEKDMSESSQIATDVVSADAIQPIVLSE